MDITEEKTAQALVVRIAGKVDTTRFPILEKKIGELMERQEFRILMDLSEMDYISSSGLRVLLMGLKKIRNVQGKFVIAGLQPNIADIFRISGFSTIFEIFATREEALRHF